MQMLECTIVELTHGVQGDVHKQIIAHLGEQPHRHTRNAVGDDQHGADGDRGAARCCSARDVRDQPVGRGLVDDRHGDGDELDEHEECKSPHHSHPQIRPIGWPDERQKAAQHGHLLGRLLVQRLVRCVCMSRRSGPAVRALALARIDNGHHLFLGSAFIAVAYHRHERGQARPISRDTTPELGICSSTWPLARQYHPRLPVRACARFSALILIGHSPLNHPGNSSIPPQM